MTRAAAALAVLVGLLGAGPATAQPLERLPAVVHVHTDATTGELSLEALGAAAARRGLGAVFLADNFLVRIEYSLPPFRALTRARWEERSVADALDDYLARVARAQARLPGVLLIPGVEVLPHYYWTGSPLALDLRAHDVQKNLLVWGLDATGLADLPVTGNPRARRYGLQSLVDAVPVLLAVPGLLMLLRPRARRVRVGRAVAVVRQRRWRLGGLLCAVAAVALVRGWPFTVDPYPPWENHGVAPQQRLIDEVERRGGVTAWSFPEARDRGERPLGPLRVSWSTEPYADDLLRTFRYTAFGGIYEDTSQFERPGNGWDRLLREYVAGERSRPAWALGESGFHAGRAGKELGLVQTVLFVAERSARGALEALRRGRLYALRRSREFGLSLAEFSVVAGGVTAGIGERLRAAAGGPLEVRIGVDADGPTAREVRAILVRDGAVVAVWRAATPFRVVHRDVFDGRPTYYRLEVLGPSADHRILANPVFVGP